MIAITHGVNGCPIPMADGQACRDSYSGFPANPGDGCPIIWESGCGTRKRVGCGFLVLHSPRLGWIGVSAAVISAGDPGQSWIGMLTAFTEMVVFPILPI